MASPLPMRVRRCLQFSVQSEGLPKEDGESVHVRFMPSRLRSTLRRDCALALQGVGEVMKKALAFGLVLVFCAAVGLAHGHDATEATITKLDMAGKSMVVKTADGKDMTIYW